MQWKWWEKLAWTETGLNPTSKTQLTLIPHEACYRASSTNILPLTHLKRSKRLTLKNVSSLKKIKSFLNIFCNCFITLYSPETFINTSFIFTEGKRQQKIKCAWILIKCESNSGAKLWQKIKRKVMVEIKNHKAIKDGRCWHGVHVGGGGGVWGLTSLGHSPSLYQNYQSLFPKTNCYQCQTVQPEAGCPPSSGCWEMLLCFHCKHKTMVTHDVKSLHVTHHIAAVWLISALRRASKALLQLVLWALKSNWDMFVFMFFCIHEWFSTLKNTLENLVFLVLKSHNNWVSL